MAEGGSLRLAADWWKSKTTWAALTAICVALGDAAAQGRLDWQQGLVIVVAVLAATIRDSLAKGQEAASQQLAVVNRALGAAAGASEATKELADAMMDVMATMGPKDAVPKKWPTTEPADGEADRTLELESR